MILTTRFLARFHQDVHREGVSFHHILHRVILRGVERIDRDLRDDLQDSVHFRWGSFTTRHGLHLWCDARSYAIDTWCLNGYAQIPSEIIT